MEKSNSRKELPPEGSSGHSQLQQKKTADPIQVFAKNFGDAPKGTSGVSTLRRLIVAEANSVNLNTKKGGEKS